MGWLRAARDDLSGGARWRADALASRPGPGPTLTSTTTPTTTSTSTTTTTPTSLRDVVASRLRILFVGINPSIRSAELGHHFSGRGNPFWRLLHAAGLTPAGFGYERDADLVELGLGITNVCPRPTRSAAELSRQELRDGAEALRRKIDALRPDVVAVVGVSLYPVVFPGGREPGPGAKRARLGGARVFVLPNPSGLNAAFPGFRHKLVWFRRLRRYAAVPARADRRIMPWASSPPAPRGTRPASGRGGARHGP